MNFQKFKKHSDIALQLKRMGRIGDGIDLYKKEYVCVEKDELNGEFEYDQYAFCNTRRIPVKSVYQLIQWRIEVCYIRVQWKQFPVEIIDTIFSMVGETPEIERKHNRKLSILIQAYLITRDLYWCEEERLNTEIILELVSKKLKDMGFIGKLPPLPLYFLPE